jgi:hypothetical protein
MNSISPEPGGRAIDRAVSRSSSRAALWLPYAVVVFMWWVLFVSLCLFGDGAGSHVATLGSPDRHRPQPALLLEEVNQVLNVTAERKEG